MVESVRSVQFLVNFGQSRAQVISAPSRGIGRFRFGLVWVFLHRDTVCRPFSEGHQLRYFERIPSAVGSLQRRTVADCL